MMRMLMKSKIHRATVTEANLHYTGSITIDRELMRAASIVPFERVQIVNIHNGTRVETYVVEGQPGSGTISMNGAAARWAAVGDKVIIISYGLMTESEVKKHRPTVLYVDDKNRVKKK